MKTLLAHWKEELTEELTGNILPFWLGMIGPDGRFPGRIDGRGTAHPEAGVGAVMTARMLWAFSAAARTLGRDEYLAAARSVYRFLAEHLLDPQYGGVLWEVAPDGTPRGEKKQSYALGFAIYALSEYARATGDATALRQAAELFDALETHVWDATRGGYAEALTRAWEPLADTRLSDKDALAVLSMNTHLHLLEPCTNLLRVWPEKRVAEAVGRLIRIHTQRLFDPATGHLGLFFDGAWRQAGRTVSYGHDIEASWLVDEAAAVAGLPAAAVGPVVEALARAAAEGLQADGSLIAEYDPATGTADRDRVWWVQAEAAVGFFNLYERTGERRWLERSYGAWSYIRERLIDRERGEWFWSVRDDGSVNRDDDKAGFWKCPYHNGRMCLELIVRIGRLQHETQ